MPLMLSQFGSVWFSALFLELQTEPVKMVQFSLEPIQKWFEDVNTNIVGIYKISDFINREIVILLIFL